MWRPGTGPRRMGKPLNNTGRRDEPDLISAKEVALGSAEACLAHGDVAGGLGRSAVLALCAGARPRRVQQADPRETVAGVVADRMAARAKQSRPNTGSRRCRRTSASTRLVDLAKLRWRIERDYQELKQEVGLGHYEGRGWRGFHHHATLCIAAYGFLIAEQATIPPSGPRSAASVQVPRLPDDYRPRGSALAA